MKPRCDITAQGALGQFLSLVLCSLSAIDDPPQWAEGIGSSNTPTPPPFNRRLRRKQHGPLAR